jgi:hypothetical protein
MSNTLLVLILAVLVVGAYLLNRQLRVIHDLVNSTLTKAQTDVELANRRIEVLEAHIAGTESGS